ncbi:MAG: alpha/beta fold hydrolase [Promethearchaeota archaeon]
MSELYAEINGINICYEVLGKGEPLILVHGYGSKKEVFIGQFKVISKKYKAIRFDNRGSGKSERPNYIYSMEMYVEDLKTLMDLLEIEKAHFLGYSLGGMIVQNFVLKYPKRVNKIILINTAPKMEVTDAEMKQYIDDKVANYALKMKDPARAFYEGAEGGYTPAFIEFMKKNPKEKIHGLFTAEDLIRDASTNPTRPQDYINQGFALLQHDVLNKLHTIKNKTLIICASEDKKTPKEQSYLLHKKIPDSTIVEIEGMHYSPKEKAPRINELILKFLNGNIN